MRLYDWETRLSRYVATVSREGFAWGRHDCALFAAGAVEAVTGTDPAADWRGSYSCEAEGLALIRAAGFRNHIGAALSWFPPIDACMILPGDLAVIDGALGVVAGEAVYVLRDTATEIGLVPIERATTLLAVR